MKTKSAVRASSVLLAGIIAMMTLTSCPNSFLFLGKLRATGSISGVVVSETGTAIVPETQTKAIAGVTVLEGQIVTAGTLHVRKTGDIAGQVTLSGTADALGIVVFIARTSFSAIEWNMREFSFT